MYYFWFDFLRLNIFDPNDFKLLSAALIAICLTIPQIKQAIYKISHRKSVQ